MTWSTIVNFAGSEYEIPNPSVDYTESHSRSGKSPGRRHANIRAILPWDIPALYAAGYYLDDAVVTLSFGGTVLIKAKPYDYDAGKASEPVTIQIRETTDLSSLAGVIPPRTDHRDPAKIGAQSTFNSKITSPVVNADTWANHREADDGKLYPFPYGRPGRIGASAIESVGAVPVPVVDTTGGSFTVLVSGFKADASQVSIYIDNATTVGVYDVTHTRDSKGRLVSVVNMDTGYSSGTNHTKSVDRSYFIAWTEGAAQSGYAGDLLKMALNLMQNVRISTDETYIHELNRFELSGYLTEQVSPIDFINGHILTYIPASLISTNEGLSVLPWKIRPGKEFASKRLDAGAHLAHLSGPKPSRTTTIENVIRINWAWDSKEQKFKYTTYLDHNQHEIARQGAENISTAKPKVIDGRSLYSRNVVDMVGAWRLSEYGQVPHLFDYAADPSIYWLGGSHQIHVGEVVIFNDADHGLNDRVMVVERIQAGTGNKMVIQFLAYRL